MATTPTPSNDEPIANTRVILLSNEEAPISFSQAMNLLLPHFVLRDELRQILYDFVTIPQDEFTTSTYFSTIPRDIFNIIREYVPDLRQTHPENPFEHIIQEYQAFADKYTKPSSNLRYVIADFNKLQQDFPIMFKNSEIEEEYGCVMKNTPNGMHICSHSDHARYVGNNTWVADSSQSDRLFGNKHMKFLQFADSVSGLAEIYILPCGLIFISTIQLYFDYPDPDVDIVDDYLPNSDIRHDYLIDLVNNRAIHITMDINREPIGIIDDFGKMTVIPNDMENIANWSHLTSDCLSVDFE